MSCSRKGFTLVELIIALSLLGIILAGIYNFFFLVQTSWDRIAAESRVIQETQLVILRMDNEIRQAQKPSETVNSVVVTSGGNQLDIYSDTNKDGKPELIRYQRTNNILKRGIVSTSSTVYPFAYGAPSVWETVVGNLKNINTQLVFILKEANNPRFVVSVHLQVEDASSSLTPPALIDINGDCAVRSKGEVK